MIAALPIIILTAVGFQLISNMSDEYYHNLISNQAAASAKHVNDFYTEQSNAISYSSNIDTYQHYLLAVYDESLSPELKDQAAKLLYLAQRVNPNVSKAYIADRYGNISLSSDPKDVGRVIADDPAFTGALSENKVAYRTNRDGSGIVLGCPITDAGGNRLGVLMRDISIDYLNRYVKELKIGDSGYMYLLDSDGATLSHYFNNRVDLFENSADPGAANLLALSKSIRDKTLASPSGFFEYSIGGKALLASYSKVAGTDWVAVAVVPLDEITQRARSFNAIMLRTGVVVVLGAVFIGLLSARRIIRPLEKIRDTVSKIAEGKLDTHVCYSGKDEFAELYADVGLMAHKLNTSYQKLSASAKTDMLTGLPNRMAIYEKMDSLVDSAGKQAALMLDLDGFKQVNDTLGHDFGDELLVIVGNIIKKLSAPNIMVSRLGGDEFFIFVSEYKERSEVTALAEKLLREISAIKDIRGNAIKISVSVGISYIAPSDADKSYLMKKADIAMYTAKKSGKNAYFEYDNSVALDRNFH